MRDLAIFPVPIDSTSDELTNLDVVYKATDVSLGVSKFGDIITVPADSSNRCIQQVMRILLSKKGSVPTEPNYGSTLSKLGVGYSPETLMEDVILILLDVENQCKNKDLLSNTVLSARLQSIELLGLDVSKDNILKISIGVTTASGVSKSFDLNV